MSDTKDLFVATLQAWIEGFLRRSMLDSIVYAKEQNLSRSQMITLIHLRQLGACSVSDIGDLIGITSAGASQLLERMVQQELVERIEDPEDRRAKLITLTGKGREMLEESMRVRRRWLEDFARKLSPEEQIQVVEVMRLLLDAIEQDQDKPCLSHKEPSSSC